MGRKKRSPPPPPVVPMADTGSVLAQARAEVTAAQGGGAAGTLEDRNRRRSITGRGGKAAGPAGTAPYSKNKLG